MRITDTSDLWWKTAVVYCLDIETYLDWDGDGTGDVAGLVHRIDYLAELGVTCLWLMPFYPTPDRDDGYDITDFYGVDPRLGNHGDLVELIRTANDRGIRVIADLVVNHTSDRHPWFRASRSSKDSPYRDWYVWRADEPPDTSDEVVFPDQEQSLWELDEKTGEYYLHRFYKHQPDLNVTNPVVRDEITKVMGFWLQLGLSGFRVDAVPYLLETRGVQRDDSQVASDPHDYLRALRAFLGRRTGDGVLLGEVNLPHADQMAFFGGEDADELTMQFDFMVMQKTYLSLARQDARPLAEALAGRPALPSACQWATFVRNHDELTLDKLSDDEREEVFAAFGPHEEMQIYGRGLIRRLPSMLDGDMRRIRLVYSLLFSLPGTPVLFYGEEIGMGENLDAGGRHAVRTPMQWSSDRNGGFSPARPSKLPSPVVTGGFSPRYVNAAEQRRDPESLLTYMTMLIGRYRECPELGWGDFRVLDQPHPAVLAHQCSWDGAVLVAVHNLGAEPVTLALQLDRGLLAGCDDGGEPDRDEPDGDESDGDESDGACRMVDLLCEGSTPVGADGRVEVVLDGYGHRWLRLVRPGDRRLT